MTTTKKSVGKNKKKLSEDVNQYDPTHEYLTDPIQRLKKRKKKFYSPLPEGAPIPDYNLESSYDYSTSFASDGYSPSSDREDAESRA